MRSALIALALGWMASSTVYAQQARPAATSAMRFDVASIHPDDTPFKPPSFALNADDSFRDPHGRFHADFALPAYIQFAYKLWLTDEKNKDMIAALPEWVHTQRFDIEATAPSNATKDDYRVMMRTLLREHSTVTCTARALLRTACGSQDRAPLPWTSSQTL